MVRDYLKFEGDLVIKNGGFAFVESTQQHQEDLLIAHPSEYGQSPTVGVDIRGFLLDEIDRADLRQKIVSEFAQDGMKRPFIQFGKDLNLTLVASYE